jgi:hypothetical protein
MDENLKPCSILRDFAGVPPCRALEAANPRLDAFGETDVMINGALYGCDVPAGAAVTAVLCPSVTGYGAPGGTVIGWKKQYPSGGVLIWLGAQWSYGYPSHRAMFRRILDELGVRPFVECGNRNIWTSLFRSGNRGMVFVINHYASPQETDLKIAGEGRVFFDQRDIRLQPMEIKHFPLSF